MSDSGAADEWDVVVPADGEELLAELRRHGVRPGQRVHLRPVGGADDDTARGTEPLPDFIGSFDSGQPDLAERSEEILRAHFPDR
jgi:hypothetical protein